MRFIHRGGTLPYPLIIQIFGFAVALHVGTRWMWLTAFSVAIPVNLWGWLAALHYRRAVLDTPTSRVGSAAQGFVELQGTARPVDGQDILSPVTQLPCLWYRYVVEQRRRDTWEVIDSDESIAAFELDDGSGVCLIDPAGAQIESSHKELRTLGDQRQTEWVLLKGDTLNAIGEFCSVRGEDQVLDTHADEGALLADWKSDQTSLKQRFDLDGDGEISQREWMLARLAARREVSRRHAEILASPARNQLCRPADRRPFLISNLSRQHMGRNYTLWAGLYIALLLVMLGGIGWALQLSR